MRDPSSRLGSADMKCLLIISSQPVTINNVMSTKILEIFFHICFGRPHLYDISLQLMSDYVSPQRPIH